MAGSQISTSVTILDSLLGFQAISLTNFATSAQSLVAAGSKIEIGSAFFTFDSNEIPNATSWTAVGTGNTAYFALVPAGTAGSQTVTAEYTDTAPTWVTSKGGWYASAASLTRYVGGVTKTSPTQYDDAFVLNADQGHLQLGGRLTLFYGRTASHVYHKSAGTEDGLFDALSPAVPDVGTTVIVGGIMQYTAIQLLLCSRMTRASTTTLTFYGMVITDIGSNSWATGTKTITDGAGNMGDVSIVA